MSSDKLRLIKDYDKLDTDIQEQIKLVFPEGFSQHLITFTNKEGNNVTALPFETFDKIYLVRMSIHRAEQIIEDDSDYTDDGTLKSSVREEYSDRHSEVDYLTENDNYDEDFEEDDDDL